ncbi:lipoyl synthase [Piscirickettsia litoralis]|uniref:Lipoyl synthase n=1 Tax=Piscirickettsia litoralis TaxID=1891921 RepID=A0ABX3A1M2_9GAMM|nr:lipoyl synthase [Piscirickettsia litoralis]ODN42766.1 lipoyl synthase [Piscirickettsia litoralis]
MSEVKTKKDPYRKQRGEEKLARIPVKIEPTTERLPKPDWIRVKLPSNNKVAELKQRLRDRKLHSVCEEAACPNLPECFGHGTATFMIMGDKCTRRCSFCDVAHGRPDALDASEPKHLAESVKEMQLKYVVITSVDRDDLRDGGSNHFAECVREVRTLCPNTRVEILVPDFRGRMDVAIDVLTTEAPDVFNHNLETAPRLYRQARPGSDYQWSLDLLKKYKARNPNVATKSGIMVGLGETKEEVLQVIQDLRDHDVEMLTVGQYLQPSRFHMPVSRYVTPSEFAEYKEFAESIGFTNAASGPMVRSSYHADLQAQGEVVE